MSGGGTGTLMSYLLGIQITVPAVGIGYGGLIVEGNWRRGPMSNHNANEKTDQFLHDLFLGLKPEAVEEFFRTFQEKRQKDISNDFGMTVRKMREEKE